MDEIDKVKEDNIDDELIFSLKPIKNKQSKIHLGSELSNVSFGGGSLLQIYWIDWYGIIFD